MKKSEHGHNQSTDRDRRPTRVPGQHQIWDGDTFLICNSNGDFTTENGCGLFHMDTRFLSMLALAFNGANPDVISSKTVDYFSSVCFLTNKGDDAIDSHTVSIIRQRVMQGGLHEELIVLNHNTTDISFDLKVDCNTDFADIFEVEEGKLKFQRHFQVDGDEHGISFTYRRDDFYRKTELRFSKPAQVKGKTAQWKIHLGAKQSWSVVINFHVTTQFASRKAPEESGLFERSENELEKSLSQWKGRLPKLDSNSDRLERVYQRSCIDLVSLKLHHAAEKSTWSLPAAGLPWYATLFGRDTLIACYQSIMLGPELSKGALTALADKQGHEQNDFTDEQPGKILHELRHGELTAMGEEPFSPYYGSIDSTILFIILLSEVYRWSGDPSFAKTMKDPFQKALNWIEEFGDMDGDGYVEYKTRSRKGLKNQGWKDSKVGIQYADGKLAEPPIALCEVQGYVFDAWMRSAELYRDVFTDNKRADDLSNRAQALQKQFNHDFWTDKRGGYFGVALDHDKNLVDSKTSNMGQLLWTGIVEKDKAPHLVKQLLSDELYSGWGIRTLGADQSGFNPISYHCGTVWPHDNSLIIQGLHRYGYDEEAARIIETMLDAAALFAHRLPETFAGYKRSRISFPARYPTSCEPQAWASAAPLLFLRTMLGLEPDVKNRRLNSNAHLINSVDWIKLTSIPAFGKKWTVVAKKNREAEVEEE